MHEVDNSLFPIFFWKNIWRETVDPRWWQPWSVQFFQLPPKWWCLLSVCTVLYDLECWTCWLAIFWLLSFLMVIHYSIEPKNYMSSKSLRHLMIPSINKHIFVFTEVNTYQTFTALKCVWVDFLWWMVLWFTQWICSVRTHVLQYSPAPQKGLHWSGSCNTDLPHDKSVWQLWLFCALVICSDPTKCSLTVEDISNKCPPLHLNLTLTRVNIHQICATMNDPPP